MHWWDRFLRRRFGSTFDVGPNLTLLGGVFLFLRYVFPLLMAIVVVTVVFFLVRPFLAQALIIFQSITLPQAPTLPRG